MSFEPAGEERKVQRLQNIPTLDGAPVTHIGILAAVVIGLAPLPLSVVIGSGKGFPMSQAIYPLVGWILGPVAGALADGLGGLLGAWIFPHTSTVPLATLAGAALGGFAAGAMAAKARRRHWWLLAAGIAGIALATYIWRAVLVNGVALWVAMWGAFIDWSALLLFILPTRQFFARSITADSARQLAIGLFGGTWMVAGLTHLLSATIVYFVINWPNPVWLTMAPVAPFEHLVRCIAGAVIGSGVIIGLRNIGWIKPEHAAY